MRLKRVRSLGTEPWRDKSCECDDELESPLGEPDIRTGLQRRPGPKLVDHTPAMLGTSCRT